MKKNYRIMTLEVIYQLLLVAGIFSAFQWVTTTNFDPYSPWLVGIGCIPLSLLLNFVNYFIRDRIKTLKIKKLRGNCSPDFLEDILRSGNF
jgi:hypothetical protein